MALDEATRIVTEEDERMEWTERLRTSEKELRYFTNLCVLVSPRDHEKLLPFRRQVMTGATTLQAIANDFDAVEDTTATQDPGVSARINAHTAYLAALSGVGTGHQDAFAVANGFFKKAEERALRHGSTFDQGIVALRQGNAAYYRSAYRAAHYPQRDFEESEPGAKAALAHFEKSRALLLGQNPADFEAQAAELGQAQTLMFLGEHRALEKIHEMLMKWRERNMSGSSLFLYEAVDQLVRSGALRQGMVPRTGSRVLEEIMKVVAAESESRIRILGDASDKAILPIANFPSYIRAMQKRDQAL